MKRYIKLFIPLCGILGLIIPLFYMNTAEITEQENRTLAKFPETTKKDKPNYEFRKEFESWLGDRFGGRDKLIDARFQTMYKINGRIENDKAFVGDDGWMFEKRGITDVPSLEDQRKRIEKDVDILKRFDDKFKGKNIPIYLVLIPDRNQLYQKYWERYYTPNQKLDYGDELIKALKDHPNIHIIYPKEEFIKNKDIYQLYRKLDVHLSYLGEKLFIEDVYKKITKSEKILYKTKSFTPLSGNLQNILHLKSDILDTALEVPKQRTGEIREEPDPDKNGSFSHIYRYSFNKGYKSPLRVHIIGPCYSSHFFFAFGTYYKEVEQVYLETASIYGKSKTKDVVEKLYINSIPNDIILLISSEVNNFILLQ